MGPCNTDIRARNARVAHFPSRCVELWKADRDEKHDHHDSVAASWTGPSVPGYPRVEVHVRPAAHGRAEAWFGGGLLAGLDAVEWILREEYDMQGAAVVHRKCP